MLTGHRADRKPKSQSRTLDIEPSASKFPDLSEVAAKLAKQQSRSQFPCPKSQKDPVPNPKSRTALEI